ncbi:glycosyltransferase family A protein [Coprobacter fastidiosus]|uniref:glycosyltransferase family A protein n=1 Tax=Coprobacter fastidiosus TaxID=1099853 RepID=UPI0022E65BFC|nr:glycosyltransferase family 2 protein [Coprobacter fastidiosus]
MNLTLAICMYNAEKYIERTLQSIVKQTMQDFHLLIIDDCSTDKSVVLVERFFEQHPRQFELCRMESNQGIAYARNFALHHADTKYLIFIDADDYPLPQLIEKEYNVISCDQELIAVSSWLQFVDTNCNPIKGGLFIGDTTKNAFMERAKAAKRIFLPIQTMFDRECAIRVGGFCCDGFPDGKPRYRDFCEDLDLWTRMSDLYVEGKYMLVLPEILYLYRKIDGLSSNHFNMIIKMEYTKTNLRRRRRGESNLSFIEFFDSIPPKKLKELKRYSIAADNLRNGVFYIREKKMAKGTWLIMKSVWNQPTYIVDKLLSNSGLFKRK